MQKNSFIKLFFILWIVLWILAFMFIPSQVDFIHGGTFGNFNDFPQKLERFPLIIATKDLLISFGAVILLTVAYIALGSGIFKLFSSQFFTEEPSSLSSWLGLLSTSFILGHAIFSFVFIVLGANHIFQTKYLWALLLTGTLIGIPSLKALYSKIPSMREASIAVTWHQAKHKTIFILTACIIFFGLFYSSTRLSYDAVAFYFSDEKLTSLTNQIQYFQNDSFIASSFQTGISYAVLITISGDQAARLYSWINGLIIILLSFAIGKKLGLSIYARLITITLLLTSTAFVDLTGDGKIDLISTAPALAAVYWAIVNSRGHNKTVALLTGTLAGVSIVSRPFNAFLVCLFIGVYYTISFFASKDKNERPAILKLAPWLGMGILTVMVSHLVINQLVLGNPLSFLQNLQIANSTNWQWTFDKDKLWIIRLLYPFALTIVNIPQSNGNISPLFVVFLPVIFSRNIRSKFKETPELTRTTLAAVITLILWNTILFTVFEIRYVLFLWVIFYATLAVTIEWIISEADIFIGKFAEFAIVIVLLFANARMIYIAIDTYSPVDKSNTPHCINHDLCAILDPINKNANAGERVFTLSAFRYYLRPDLLACSSRHDEYQLLQSMANNNPSQFWTEVYRLGFKYVTFEPRYSKVHLGFHLIPGNENVPDWMELIPLYNQPPGYSSYEIRTKKTPPLSVEITCKQNSGGVWGLQSIKK